jgi:HK97 family phage portal protein
MHVTESTALTSSAVWACVSLISSDVASLPFILYKRVKDQGKHRYTDHITYELLHDAPNPEMTAMVFRETMQAHLLLWGNAYAEIVRDGGWPLTPDRVNVRRDVRTQQLAYDVARIDGAYDSVPAANMLHIAGLGFDGMRGYSVISHARESVGLSLATERFGGTFFGNGASFGGVFQHPGRMSEPAIKNFRESVNAQHQGVERSGKFIVTEEGMTYTRLGIPPNDAQFLETRKFQVTEIARWFRVPPHKIQELDRSTYNNIEHQGIEYYTDTLRPWLVRWEQEINRKLISRAERKIQYVEHLVEGVLRGDLASRYAAYAIGRQWGWLSPNDVREKENLNPLPVGGDIYLVPTNMAPADRLTEIIDAQIAAKNTPAPAQPAPPPADPGVNAGRMVELIQAALVNVETRIAETTAKITTAEADALRWKESAGAFEADVAVHRTDLATAQAEANRLKAVLLEATERADRLALEQEALRTEVDATKSQLHIADQMMAETSKHHLDAVTRADALQVERDRLAAAQVDATQRFDQVTADHAAAVLALQTATDAERHAAEQRVSEQRSLVDAAEQARDARALELATLESMLATAQAQVATVTAELEALRAQHAALTRDAIAAKLAAAQAIADAAAARTTAEQTLVEQATSLEVERKSRAETEAALSDVRASAAAASSLAETTKSAAEIAAAETLAIRTAAEQAAIDHAHALATEQADKAALQAELERLKHAEIARVEALHLAQEHATQALATASEATAVRAVAEQMSADQATKLAIEQAANAATQAEMAKRTQAFAAHRRALRSAHRHQITDAVAKLIYKETERATKNQATPEKLRSWAESFYLLHEDNYVDSLRSVMRQHLVLIGSSADVDAYTRAKVHPHLTAALTQLRTICDGDPAEFHITLERLKTRWLQDRPAALADVVAQDDIETDEYLRSVDPTRVDAPAPPQIHIHNHPAPTTGKSVKFTRNVDGSVDSASIEDD